MNLDPDPGKCGRCGHLTRDSAVAANVLLEAADHPAHSYASADTLVENLVALAALAFLSSDIDLAHFDNEVPTHERRGSVKASASEVEL